MYAEYDRVTRCAVLAAYRSVPDVDAYARAQMAALRPLDRPALVLWGGSDPYLPTTLAEAQRDTFPHADVHVFGDAGHWPFIDDPGAAAALLKSFLTRFLPPTAPQQGGAPVATVHKQICRHRRRRTHAVRGSCARSRHRHRHRPSGSQQDTVDSRPSG
jgi:hypothetical protein